MPPPPKSLMARKNPKKGLYMKIKKYLWPILLGVLLLATLVMIISFSSESKESSGERSHGVTEQVVSLLVPDYEQMTPEEQTATVAKFHRPIRKLAHFAEFFLLGVLCAVLMCFVKIGPRWVSWIAPVLFCLVFATADEVWQIFTHRGASPVDVCIDFMGSVVGIAMVRLIVFLLQRRRNKKEASAS